MLPSPTFIALDAILNAHRLVAYAAASTPMAPCHRPPKCAGPPKLREENVRSFLFFDYDGVEKTSLGLSDDTLADDAHRASGEEVDES
jgi:hypothetical protein